MARVSGMNFTYCVMYCFPTFINLSTFIKVMKFLLPTLFAVLLLSSCEKEPPVLPEITTNGANTFGCKLNNQVFLPRGSGFYDAGGGAYYKPTGGLSFNLHNSKHFGNYRIYVRMKIDSLLSPGVYTDFDYWDTEVTKSGYGEDEGNNWHFQLDTTANNWIEISVLDTISPILSGTFGMKLIDSESGDIMNVTDGRFDYSNGLRFYN